MYATKHFETGILNAFNNVNMHAPANLYVALFPSDPGEYGTGSSELSYSGYTRQRIVFTEPYLSGENICVKNENDILFPAAPSEVGFARYIGLVDSPVARSGNMWVYGELLTPIEIRQGQQPSLYAGDVTFYTAGCFSRYFKTVVMNALRGADIEGFTPRLCLFDGDPEQNGVELGGSGYERVTLVFGPPETATGGQSEIRNTQAARFPAPKASWGLWAFDGIRDAVTGGNLILKTANMAPETILRNYVPTVDVGGYKISIN